MRKQNQKVLINRIRDTLVREYNPEKVILFGSRARGKSKRTSDFDLFVVKRTTRRKVDRMRDVSNLFTPRDFSLDVIVSTPAEVDRRLEMGDPFYREILNHGRVLYEK
jgi:predicted nucleotidyltransferase